MREAGLPARCLHEPDLKEPTVAVARLLELAARRGNEPAFGLRSALKALVRHIHVHNEALVVRVEQVSNLVVIRAELLSEGGQRRCDRPPRS